MPDNRPILVLGAAGFIGSALVAYLTRAGIAVTAVSRRDTGTLEASSDWSALLEGCRAVVHLASLAHAPAAGTAWIDAEAATAAALAAAARGAGVERIVLLSSIKVHGDDTGTGRFRASDRPAPGDDYGRCKLAIEQAMAAEGGRLVVLRPPLVYGPGVKGNFLALLRLVAAGVPLPLASVANRRSVVFLDNLLDLIAIALSNERANGAYLVRDNDEVSTPVLVRMIARGLGRRARLFPCPPALVRAAGRLAGRTEAALRLTGSLSVDDQPTRDALGWRPRVNLANGIAATCRWFRAERGPGPAARL
jgi:nucleoside-diphosphate-sugar epimerase